MSYRFSRRSTRVQPKPKVCKSEKPPRSPTTPTVPDAVVSLAWNSNWLFPSYSSFFAATSVTAAWTGTNWQLSGNDGTGKAFTATWTYPIGSPGTFHLTIAGWPAGPTAAQMTIGTWNGSLPFSQAAIPITGWTGFGSSSGTFSFAIS